MHPRTCGTTTTLRICIFVLMPALGLGSSQHLNTNLLTSGHRILQHRIQRELSAAVIF